MTKFPKILTALTFLVGLPFSNASEEPASIAIDDDLLVHYQSKPLSEPIGGNAFKGSNFLHPIKTPAGFVVTDSQPEDHLHHFGLWWPWKHIEAEGRKILCWELQGGDGIIEADNHVKKENALLTNSHYIDRRFPDGPTSRLNETTNIEISKSELRSVDGYFIDLDIAQTPTREETVTITPYRYSGFSIRATSFWNKDNSSITTSEGKDRDSANFTHARWVLVQGKTASDGDAGILLMSHPNNQSHPEKLRTWDKQHNGAVFVNFNTVADDPWVMEHGKRYARNYRTFVFDGVLSPQQAEELWRRYAANSK